MIEEVFSFCTSFFCAIVDVFM